MKDKIRDLIAQALAGYLEKKPSKKKSKKKEVQEEKKPGISVNQTVHVGAQDHLNDADIALGRLRKNYDLGFFKKDS